jgi:16S rRNA G966 N2-methylase RsmD
MQYDKKWLSDRGFVFYDFNDLNTIPASMHGTFDLVVVDPPFIVREVWEKYAAAVKLLVKPGKDESSGTLPCAFLCC